MSAGLLTVVNPRRRRRRRVRRARRAAHARNPVRRRRRRVARAAHPVRRRRRLHARRRRSNPRRRRHRNPFGGGVGNIVGTLTKGLTAGAAVVAVNLATNGANYLIKGGATGTGKPLDGLAKTALKGAIGLIVLPMALKMIPGGRKFAGPVALGAGIAVMLDIYEQHIKTNLPVYLQDYGYGALSDWAPLGNYQRAALSDWAPQMGGGAYDSGAYD